jgi:hypothetical protein
VHGVLTGGFHLREPSSVGGALDTVDWSIRTQSTVNGA